jgi:hypothetical protein
MRPSNEEEMVMIIDKYKEMEMIIDKYKIDRDILSVSAVSPDLFYEVFSDTLSIDTIQSAFCDKSNGTIYVDTIKSCILLLKYTISGIIHGKENSVMLYKEIISNSLENNDYNIYIDDTVIKMLLETKMYIYFMDELAIYLSTSPSITSSVFNVVIDFTSKNIRELDPATILYLLNPLAMNTHLTDDQYNKLIDIGGKYIASTLMKNPAVPDDIKAKARLYLG